MSVRGFEPRTNRLKAYCSTFELYTLIFFIYFFSCKHNTIDPTIVNNKIIDININKKYFCVNIDKNITESPEIHKLFVFV